MIADGFDSLRARGIDAAHLPNCHPGAAHGALCPPVAVLRDLLGCENPGPPWRDLLPLLRTMEARCEIRGGRFESGFTGEQFARPEALGLLRGRRRQTGKPATVSVSNADPLNLTGIILPGA